MARLLSVETAQNLGFYSLLYLTQTLGTQNIDHEIEMVVVSNHLQNVTGEETIAPEKATTIGPVRVIPQEYNHIHCRIVDIVLPPSGSQAKAKVINQLLNELQHKSENKIIAYRGNFRWVKTFEPVRLEQSSVETLPFKQGGVYLITGGMGGIGLVFAEYLAKTAQAKLVLTRHSAFPERHEWEKWLTNHSEEDPTSSKIRKVQQWEELGAKVLVVNADVANQQQMAEAISLAQNQFGQINGVIHAAGVPGGGVIQRKTREIAERVLAPKVQGTTILEILLKEVPLDFMVVCSSNESLWGNFGQIDYCGANNFLDAYAQSKSADSDRLTISINWDSWQEVGMAVKAALAGSALITSLDEGILPQEGVEALNRILDNGMSQVLVSTQDLQYVIDQTGFLTQNQSAKSSLVELSERLELSETDDAPQSQIEKTIVQIWQEVLGIKNIGVNDNLFNLGGDSLAAVQLIAKLNKKLNVKFSVNSLLNYPTIKGLAELVSPSSQTQQKELPSCLIKLRNGSDQKKPLFLVHPVGGTAFVFQDLANNLDPAQPVYGIQVPEVDSKPQIFNTIEAMATHYIEAISTVQPKGPYHIGGMSLGGMIAYEMAQQLTKQGEEIGLLTLFDTAISNKLPTSINSDLEIMAYWLDSDKESNEGISLKILQSLEPNEQLRYFWQRSRIAKSMVLKDDVTMFRNFLDLFISMLRLGNKYAPTSYQGKVLFFVAEENDGFNRHHPEKDWLEFAEIVTEEIPGNHMTMMHHPQVDVIAQKLQKYLDQAELDLK